VVAVVTRAFVMTPEAHLGLIFMALACGVTIGAAIGIGLTRPATPSRGIFTLLCMVIGGGAVAYMLWTLGQF
jgi:hypothetical protein